MAETIARLSRAFLTLTFCLNLVLSPGYVSAQIFAKTHPENQSIQQLELNRPIERELAPGEIHLYRIAAFAGEHLRVEIEERGVEVVVTLSGPDNQRLAQTGVASSRLEIVSVIAETPGEHQLEIRSATQQAAGRYVVRLAARRAATAPDRERVAAERAFDAGQQLRLQRGAEAWRGAVAKYEEALALFTKLGDQRGAAFTLSGLGTTLNLLGERRRAVAINQRALPLIQVLGERRAEGELLLTLGTLSYALNEQQQTLEYFEQALAVFRALGDRAREAQALASVGLAHAALGDRPRAIEYYQQALALQRALGDRAGEARALLFLGENHEALGEKQKAVEYLLQALPLQRGFGTREGETNTLYQLGLTYDSLNEREKAVEYFGQALALRKALGHPSGQSYQLKALGDIYGGLRDYPQALTHYQQALALFEAEKNYRLTASILRDLGLIYDAQGEKAKAAEYFQRALPLFRLGSAREWYPRLLANLGKVLSESGQHEQALVYLNEALPSLQQLNQKFFELFALYWIARAERGRGQLAAARSRIEEALGKIEQMRLRYYEPELRAVAFTKARDFYELEMDLLLRLHQSQPSPELVAAALEISEQARARTMLDLLTEAQTDIRQGIAPELLQRAKEGQSRLSRLQGQLFQAQQESKQDQKRIAAWQAELKRADEEREQLEREIHRTHPRYAALLYPVPLKAEAIRNLLDGETALLEYALGSEASYLFVVTREGIQHYRLPKAAEIAALVQEIRARLGQPGRREFGAYAKVAEQLYHLLVAPAAEVLAKKQRLLVAPDGALYYLPFEALLGTGTGTGTGTGVGVGFHGPDYLLKRWAISYVPSASVLDSLRQQRPGETPAGAAPKQLLVFADPSYAAQKQILLFGEPGRGALSRLAASNREAIQIARLYPRDQTASYLGEAASEENVKNNPVLATARRVHFATHGLVSEKQPQHSGLVLTLDDDPQEDGFLQVHEIFNLKLNAELVVLSACRTGLGKELKGEGLIGLTRAFMYAGARSLVVSLWEVADTSTADLMVAFYRRLDRGSDKAEALRQAKLELLRNPRYAHPYYWAPFVLTGEPK